MESPEKQMCKIADKHVHIEDRLEVPEKLLYQCLKQSAGIFSFGHENFTFPIKVFNNLASFKTYEECCFSQSADSNTNSNKSPNPNNFTETSIIIFIKHLSKTVCSMAPTSCIHQSSSI